MVDLAKELVLLLRMLSDRQLSGYFGLGGCTSLLGGFESLLDFPQLADGHLVDCLCFSSGRHDVRLLDEFCAVECVG